MSLGPIFEPRSIAVIGASATPAKRGHQIFRALLESGYAGRVYPVNPAGGSLLGREVHPTVGAIPEAVDLAVLCTPGRFAPGLVQECGERGVAGVVVLAVGFGEAGPKGAALEARLLAAAAERGVRVVGPNTSGLLNLPLGVNLIGARGVRPGGLALLVQSGNIALDLMTRITARTGMGVSICCGLGNEVDVGFGEVLEFLGDHADTRAIICHVEGCRDTRAFLVAAAAVTPRKPVIAIKSGRTAAGAHAALSHTGAIAGPYDRLRAGFAQAGIVEVTRTDELLEVAAALGSQRWGAGEGMRGAGPVSRSENEELARSAGPFGRPDAAAGTRSAGGEQPAGSTGRQRGVGILSDGGGQSTLAVDALHEMGVPLARLSDETSARLRARLGPAAAVRTPVDVAGAADADPGAFADALAIIAQDDSVGAVLLVGLFGGYGIRFSETLTRTEIVAARSMARLMRERGKGLVVHSQYEAHPSQPLDVLRAEMVPVIGSLEVACRAVAELQRRAARTSAGASWGGKIGLGRGTVAAPVRGPEGQSGADPRPLPSERDGRADREETDVGDSISGPVPHPVLAAAQSEGRRTLSETESRTLLAESGLKFARAVTVRSGDEAAAALRDVDGPVAIKLVSRHIVHKTDAGGVELGVATAEEARAAFERILAAAREYARAHGLPAERHAVTVAPMLPQPVAELLVGATRDPQLGPVLTVGAGGIWVEVLRDVAHRVLPVDGREMEAAIRELKIAALFDGARGQPPVRIGPVVAAARAVAACLMRWPEVAEVEVNPLFVYEDRAVGVDGRVVRGAVEA